MHHLTLEQFNLSLKQQKNILNPNGINFMTLSYGGYREELMFDGEIRYTHYTEKYIEEIVKEEFEILHMEKLKNRK